MATPVRTEGDAANRVADVYAEIRDAFGLVPPPLSLHAPVPDLLAAAWNTLRETVIVERHLPRAVKEAMAVAVSQGNRCSYCVDAHAVALHATGAGTMESALRTARERLDPRTRALVSWAAESGRPRPAREPVPCSAAELPEALGTVLCFHYVNRLVTILLPSTLLPLGGSALRPLVLRAAGTVLRRRIKAPDAPKRSARLTSASIPAHLGWAATEPAIASAFAQLDAALSSAARFLPDAALERLHGALDGWIGDEPPLGTAWLEAAVESLRSEDGCAVRLMLLTARAPHRIQPSDLQAFRDHWPDEAALIAALGYASFTATRRISTWL